MAASLTDQACAALIARVDRSAQDRAKRSNIAKAFGFICPKIWGSPRASRSI